MAEKIRELIKYVNNLENEEYENEVIDRAETGEEEKEVIDNVENDKKVKRIAGFHINDTGKELLVGNVVYYVIGQIIILVLANNKMYMSLGFLAGVVISMIMTFHMIISVEQALSFNDRGANVHIKKTAIIRLVICGALLIIIGYTRVVDIIGTLIGIMALKVSAYLQPLTHKVLVRKSKGKGR